MKVNIIGIRDNWIGSRITNPLLSLDYTEFIERNGRTKWFDNPKLHDKNRINYFSSYVFFIKELKGMKNISMFFHIAYGKWKSGEKDLIKTVGWCDEAIYMNETCRQLGMKNYPNMNHHLIRPGIESSFVPKLVVGFPCRLDNHRKNPKFIEILKNLDFLIFKTSAKNNGVKLSQEAVVDIYNSVDYVVITSNREGGPMAIVEGLACGKKFICPEDIGWAREFKDHMITYKKNDLSDLTRILKQLYEEKIKKIKPRLDAVKDITWDNWIKDHDKIFRSMGAG